MVEIFHVKCRVANKKQDDSATPKIVSPFMCTNYSKGYHIIRFSGVVMSFDLYCTCNTLRRLRLIDDEHVNQSTARDVEWSTARLRASLVTPTINFSCSLFSSSSSSSIYCYSYSIFFFFVNG